MYRRYLSIATVLCFGCTEAPIEDDPPTEEPEVGIDLSVVKPLCAGIRRASQTNLYEGLPHQYFERASLQRELDSKATVRFNDYPF